jgi:hypothetical protein
MLTNVGKSLSNLYAGHQTPGVATTLVSIAYSGTSKGASVGELVGSPYYIIYTTNYQTKHTPNLVNRA